MSKGPRKRRSYPPVSEVTVIDADTGEVVGQEPPLDPHAHKRVVARGNKRARPSARATKRRNHDNTTS